MADHDHYSSDDEHHDHDNDAGTVNYDQHYNDYEHLNVNDHYYVRTDDDLIVHDNGAAYFDYCSKYDDYGTTDLYDNNGCRITITTSCPSCGVHHIRPTTSAPEHFDAPQFDHIDKHDHYVHNDDDYLHDTAPDDDGYNEYDEYDDPADYEHLVTGYEDSFHHDRRISTITYPVVSITSAEAKRLFDLIRGGAGGPYNEHHHIARGGNHHNDDSPTSAT